MQNLAPAVVAVIVTHDPGPWFEETLQSLAAQDYPELSVLVLDAGSVVDPTPRVAAILPGAFVRRLPENRGFAATADTVLGMVAGASHLLLCHDDVALDSDVVHVLVEESFRSNAGVVGPKLVSWDDPSRLLHVGMAVDKGGAVVDRVEPGEVDHGQHDAVQDVFLAPGGCLLVRADLFAELGGFDPSVVALGDDLDLCWRAQVAGARVVVAPAARVRHLERLAAGARPLPLGAPSLQALQRRHELRIVLIAYSRFHLLRVLPQLLLLSAGEMVVSLFTGNRRRVGAVWHAWRWNWSSRKDLRAARAALAERRRLGDVDVRRLQLHGSARLAKYLRRLFTQGLEVAHGASHDYASAYAAAGLPVPAVVTTPGVPGGHPDDGGAPGHGVPGSKDALLSDGLSAGGLSAGADSTDARAVGAVVDDEGLTAFGVPPGHESSEVAYGTQGGTRHYGRFVTLVVVALILIVGSRQLFGPGLPWFGGMLALPSWGALLHRFDLGWQAQGLTGAGPTSPATGPLGVAALLLAGSSGALRDALVLGCIPLGAWGVARLVRPFASTRARVAAWVAYLALPVAYDALAQGRWDALLAYATAPWIVLRLARASGLEPFQVVGRQSVRARRRRRPGRQALALGLLEAALCSLVPAGAGLTLVMAIALALGIVLVTGGSGRRAAARIVAVAGGATVVSAVLLAPWSFTLLQGPLRWEAVTGLRLAPGTGPGWADLLRLAIGPIGDTPLAYGLVAAAALPLFVAVRHRLTWAAASWALIGSCLTLAWCEGRGWTGPFAVDPQMLLVPAAVGVAVGIGLGVAAFESDLPARRFGWRQGIAAGAAVMAAVGALPVLAAAASGRWDVPLTGYGEATAWMAAKAPPGGFRVLWLADPRTLPGGGWELQPGVAYAVSDGGLPDLTASWAGSDPGGQAARLARELVQTENHGTVQLGQELAPLHIRYVVVVEGLAPEIPGYQTPPLYPVTARLTTALAAQGDLTQVPGQGGLEVYTNDAAPGGRLGRHGVSAVAYRAGQGAELVVWLVVLAVVLGRMGRSARRRRGRWSGAAAGAGPPRLGTPLTVGAAPSAPDGRGTAGMAHQADHDPTPGAGSPSPGSRTPGRGVGAHA